ncbi:MAG: hypothetical protein H0U70_03000 [Tatlockia sp.]|nr:hypothetical protein [Tatlockia sp.]
MQERNTLDYKKNYTQFFRYKDESTPPIDESFLEFKIPSARDLYHKIIERNSYALISKLSLEELKLTLASKDCDVDFFFSQINIEVLSETLNYYIFHFKEMDNELTAEQAFFLRNRLLAQLNALRLEEVNNNLFVDDSSSIRLHLSDTENYRFATDSKLSNLPNSYRALCIYDLIVEDLYLHNLRREDNNYKDSLISDYLSIHSSKFAEYGWNGRFSLSQKLQECLKNITCDRKAATLLEWSFDETYEDRELEFNRGILATLPLTASASLETNPAQSYSTKRYGLNSYSYYYCSLIQYRYLQDLKVLFLPIMQKSATNSRKDESHLEFQQEIEQLKAQFEKWKEFKNQPMVIKLGALIDKIEDIRRQDHKKPGRFYAGNWPVCYWEEKAFEGSEQKPKIILIKALYTLGSQRLFKQAFAIKIQQELRKSSLTISRANLFLSNDSHYAEGYYFSVKQEDIAKCSLRNLLVCSEATISTSKNVTLVQLMLANHKFFTTKRPIEWLECLQDKNMKTLEMTTFIWKLATWPKVKVWLNHQKPNVFYENNSLPLELLLIITSFLAKLLEEDVSQIKDLPKCQ